MPRRLSTVAVLLSVMALLAACQTGGPGRSGAPNADVTPNAVAGDPIEVTPLDAAPDADPALVTTPAVAAAGSDIAAPQAAPATEPEPTPAEAAAEPAPQPDLAETPVTPKSERQLACEKKKGRWARVGDGDGRACVFQTKDAGKRCERESQCDSVCLARSGTCAPFKPMYGCNEILQDNGMRVTLCLD